MYNLFIDKIEDLGITDGVRFWRVRCNVCSKAYKARASNVKFRKRSVCVSCNPIVRHGSKHKSREHPLYPTWSLMIRRVDNTPNKKFGNDHHYDGITVCEEWKEFLNFKEWSLSNGYSLGLTIDRKDNDKGYTPSNCRWVDNSTQAANKKVKSNNTTGYSGVCLSGRSKMPYLARLNWQNAVVFQERFKTLKGAVEARNNEIILKDLPHPIQHYKE